MLLKKKQQKEQKKAGSTGVAVQTARGLYRSGKAKEKENGGRSRRRRKYKKNKKKTASSAATTMTSLMQWMYLERVVIHTIKASLSLQRPKEDSSDVYVGFKPGRIMHDLMMRIENAQFKLDPLVMQNVFVTTHELRGAFMQHYNRALKKHLFSTLGSLQALGNPVGLVRGMVGDLI